MALAYTFNISPYTSFGALTALILTPFGFTVPQISWMGAASVVVGAASAVGFGIFLDRKRAYKKTLIVGCIFCLIMSILFPRMLLNGVDYSTLVCVTMIYVAFIIPMIPLCMSLSAEVTHPMNPSLAIGTL